MWKNQVDLAIALIDGRPESELVLVLILALALALALASVSRRDKTDLSSMTDGMGARNTAS